MQSLTVRYLIHVNNIWTVNMQSKIANQICVTLPIHKYSNPNTPFI